MSSQPHTGQLRLLRYLPEQEQLLSLDSTGHLVRWKRSTAGFSVAEQIALPLLPMTAELDLTRDRLLIAPRGREIRSFSLETEEEIADEALLGHRLNPLAISCSETHPRCASGGVGGEVILWNMERAHPLLASTRKLDGSVQTLRRQPGGELEVLIQSDHGIAWASVRSLAAIHNRHLKGLVSVGAQEDSEAVVLGYSDGRVALQNDASSRKATSLKHGNPRPIIRFAVSPRFVAGVDQDHRLFIWQRERPEAPFFVTQRPEMVTALLFSPDERILVAGHLGGGLARWDLTQKPPRLQQAHEVLTDPIFALAFSPDGRRLFTGSGGGDRHIRLWEPWSMRFLRDLPERHTSSLSELRVSPDAKLLVSAADDGDVVFWETDTWREVGSLPHGIDTLFQSLAFNREGTRLMAASNDQIWMWRISDKDLLEAACKIANRTIDSAEWEQSVGGSRPKTGCKH